MPLDFSNNDLSVLLYGKVPEGPFRYHSGYRDPRILLVNLPWPMEDDNIVDAFNRAIAIGRWLERTESEPPLAEPSTYMPICHFCHRKVDELITVHMEGGDKKMCMKCFMWLAHRKVTTCIIPHDHGFVEPFNAPYVYGCQYHYNDGTICLRDQQDGIHTGK